MKDGWKEESPARFRRGQKGKGGDCSLRKSELQAECPKQAEVSITHVLGTLLLVPPQGTHL